LLAAADGFGTLIGDVGVAELFDGLLLVGEVGKILCSADLTTNGSCFGSSFFKKLGASVTKEPNVL
jgi:hypothetical protein